MLEYIPVVVLDEATNDELDRAAREAPKWKDAAHRYVHELYEGSS